MKVYVLYNFYGCYNIYLTKEHAVKALEILKVRYNLKENDIERNIIIGHKNSHTKNLYIFEVDEGETFGDHIMVNHKLTQDCIITDY